LFNRHIISIKNNTALLVFSLSAREEAERKSLFGNSNKSLAGEFFQQLISETERISASSGVDVIWFDEKKQHGNSFGSRFSGAFQQVFAAGYDNVISIGNDCPYLTSEILEKAIQKIQQKDMVLGPAQDGGAYLIGLNKSVFDPEAFEALSWQKESLFSELLAYSFQNRQSLECLAQLNDVNKIQDVLKLIQLKPETFLRYIIWCLKSCTKRLFYLHQLFKNQFNKTYFSLRAPPGIA